MKHPPFSLAWPFLHRGWVWILPTEISDCNGILVKKRRMRFNLSRGSELTTLVKSTITTFQGPWPREGVTLDLIWASFMRTFLAPARWLNYQRVFFMRKICRQERRSIFISLCGGRSRCNSWLVGELRRQRMHWRTETVAACAEPKTKSSLFQKWDHLWVFRVGFFFFSFFKTSHLNKKKNPNRHHSLYKIPKTVWIS